MRDNSIYSCSACEPGELKGSASSTLMKAIIQSRPHGAAASLDSLGSPRQLNSNYRQHSPAQLKGLHCAEVTTSRQPYQPGFELGQSVGGSAAEGNMMSGTIVYEQI